VRERSRESGSARAREPDGQRKRNAHGEHVKVHLCLCAHTHTDTLTHSRMRTHAHVHHSAHPRTGEPSFSSRRCCVMLPLLTPSGRCGKTGLFVWKKRPIEAAEKRPYKRDLITPAFSHALSAPPVCVRARVRARVRGRMCV